MKRERILIFIIFITSLAYSRNVINYMDPKPNSKYVNINNNIVLGFEKQIFLTEAEIANSITISSSGNKHLDFTVRLYPGNKKIIIKHQQPFREGINVDVKIHGKLEKVLFNQKNEFEYSFTTSAGKPVSYTNGSSEHVGYSKPGIIKDDPLPYPPMLSVTINNNPSPGYIFLAPYTSGTFLVITNKYGQVYWYYESNRWLGDFKKQPNGHLTYWDGTPAKHFELSENYNVVDSYYCGNGFYADIHELRALNNRHAYLMAYDTQTVDMSHIVQGGNPNATVVGLIIQEIDENKDVIFQWRSWDHIPITDALHENLTAAFIDYVHGNAIEIDNDSNIFISSRHLDEITKINRTTGNIIWRLGGLQNQFTFINDTVGFNYQHAVRKTTGNNIILYDNGNWHTPQFSRAVEYEIDETNKTATLVWEYRHNPRVFGAFMGNAQRLENGNTLIAWGGTTPTITEVTPNGTIVFEASYPGGVYTYRAFKYEWNTPVSVKEENRKTPASFKLHQNYPNPFNPVTRITYDIPEASQVELTVFDITGRELKKLESGYFKAGSYTALFDAAQYASGIYVYRLKAGGFTASQKMLLIK